MNILGFFCVESALGRLDYTSLSQQTLMEMVIDQIKNKKTITGSKKSTDISSWKNVELNTKDEVLNILWKNDSSASLKGTICLEWLPSTVESLNISYNEDLEGSIDISKLPQALIHLRAPKCGFSGEIAFEKLVEPIETVILFGNDFVGSLNLERLPDTLKELDVDCNRFSGSVNLTKLPESLTVLLIQDNELSGELDLTCLPSSLDTLRIGQNDFHGETDFSELPDSLQTFSTNDTDLEGSVFLDDEKADFDFGDSKVQAFSPVYLLKRDKKGRYLLTSDPWDTELDKDDRSEFYIRKEYDH